MSKASDTTVHKPAPGLTPEQARDIRAHAWRYIFDCYERHKATKAQNGDIEASFFEERDAHESGHANHRSGGGDF